MSKLSSALAVFAISACATGQSAKPFASTPFCLPCTNPCLSPDSCEPATPKPTASVKLDPPPGYYSEAKQLALSSASNGAVIHYTTDGSAPTAASPVYTGPLNLDANATINAVAIAPGLPPSDVASGAYAIAVPEPAPAAASAAPEPAAAPGRVAITAEKLELREKILFDMGKATIRPESHALLDEVATVLNAHPEVNGVRIEGHTDNKGFAALNRKLSQRRAQSVRDYLIEKGVAADRLSAKGFGPARPIADENTAKGREENRRVEFVVTAR